MDIPTENNEPPISDAQYNKRRRKKSLVWDYFTIETVGVDCTRACCKQCKKSFAYITGSKLAGTSHLKRHIVLGICPVSRHNREKNQLIPYAPGFKPNGVVGGTENNEPPRKRPRTTPVFPFIPFSQDLHNHDLAKMIILHEYPLNIVEHQGFIDFVRSLQPKYNMVSVDSMEMDCVSVYLSEKQRLSSLLCDIPGRVSLTLDLWTTDETLGYLFLTGQFVDVDWKLQRRILNVIMVPFPDSESAFNHAVIRCMTDWGLNSKLFILTLDESFANITVRENLRTLLSIRNPLVLNGQLLVGNCYARVLTSLAEHALDSMKKTVNKVRESVKYVKTIEGKFIELKQQLQVPSMKSLTIDNQTKWNTTYHMLVSALELKEVFSCLSTSDPNYKETPSMEDWKQLETLCTYLKLLFDAANVLIAVSPPTANLFFHEVWKIQYELIHGSISTDPFVSTLIKPLKEKFDQYWRNTNLVLAIAAVMDPRFKMKLVDFSFSRIYGDEAEGSIRIVEEGVHELFLEYIVQSLPPPNFFEGNEIVSKTELVEEGETETLLSTGDGLSDFEVYISEINCNQQMKSELDQYLEEPLLPRVQEFDVLGWWKLNMSIYPTLSRMASDVLSIPVSTVSPDSVFDTVSKKMDSYHASLSQVTLEALICVKDWVQFESLEISTAIVKTQNF